MAYKLDQRGYIPTKPNQRKSNPVIPSSTTEPAVVVKQDDEGGERKETGKAATGGEIVKNAVCSGLNQFNKGLFSTLDLLLPTEFLGKYDLISKANDYYSELERKYSDKLEESTANRSKFVQLGAQTLENVVAAAPNAALAMMTGGSSAAAQGSTAALTTASGAAQSSGLLANAANAVQGLLKNPLYWSSVGQTLGNSYEDAKAKEANEWQAIASAYTSSLLNSALEVAGGTETLPGVLKSGTSPVAAWAKSALTEGLEEPVQSTVSGLSDMLFYDKDKPLVSLTDPDAVLHPWRMGQEFAMGTAVGGILGAGQLAGNKLYTSNTDAPTADYTRYMEELQEEIRQQKLNALMAEYEKHVGTVDRLDALTGNNYDEQKEVALYGETGVGRAGQADRKGQSEDFDTGRGRTTPGSVPKVYGRKAIHGWPGQLTQENILGEEPVRVWVSSGIIEPHQGSVAHAEQQLAKEYNIPCFVVADKAWEQNKGEVPAFAAGGQIYLKQTLPEEQRGMFVAHEATHVMRQVNYPPYVGFLQRTPNLLDIGSEVTATLIEGCAAHCGIDPMNMTDAERDTLYDEINATVFGSIAANDEIALSYVRPAFRDFDAYSFELTELHQRFKNHRFQRDT